MDWDKYRRYSNNWDYNTTINFCDTINKVHDAMRYTEDVNDNVVADVTDSYKELSSERIEE